MITTALSRSKRVLVVCGSQWSRSLLRAQLRRSGFVTLGAGTPEIALSYGAELEGQPLHLLIVDWDSLALARDFEPASSLKLARRLREIHPDILSLVLYSRDGSPPGSWDVVLKRPGPLTEVVARVHALLGSSPA